MTAAPQPLPTRRACDLDAQSPAEQWLIRELWGRGAAGIIGGAPKCAKSWLALDIALSVASATPCLGRFEVDHPGPVLIYLAEDPLPAVRARLDGLCAQRNLDLARADLHAIDTAALRLDLETDQRRLYATLAALRPHLLVLDPLVRLHRLDENSASDISRLLGFLTELQRALDLAIVLVHHASKKHRAQPGQSLRGSSDLHAWGASNAYLARRDEHLLLTLEHRAARPPEPMLVELVSRPDGSATHLALRAGGQSAASVAPIQQILTVLREADGPVLRKDLRARLRINNHRLGEALEILEQRRLVQRTADGWRPLTSPPQVSLVE